MNTPETYLGWISQNLFDIAVIFALTGLFFVVGSMAVRAFVRRAVHGARARTWHQKDIQKRQDTLSALFVTLWRIVIVASGVMIILGKIPGVNLAPLFASAGVVGVALGFGSQSLIKDFLSGIFIVSDNQYRVGDVIEIDGNGGSVMRIGARSTVIRDASGDVHYFPNGSIQHVINKTMGYSMARFSITVHPDGNLDNIIAIINEIGETLAGEDEWSKKIIDAPAFVSVGEFSANSVSLLVAGKVQPSDQWSVAGEMRRRILSTLTSKKILLASPPIVTPAK